jgi:hypothetical protein
MNTAISFVEYRNGFAAERQEFFVRGQPHSSILRPMIRPSTIDAPRRGD